MWDNYNEQTAELLGAVPTSYEVTSRDDGGPFFGAFEDTYEPVYSYEDGHKIDLLDRDIASYREQFPRATLTPDFSNVSEVYSPPLAPSNFFTDFLFGKQAHGANTPYPGGPFLGQNFGGGRAGTGGGLSSRTTSIGNGPGGNSNWLTVNSLKPILSKPGPLSSPQRDLAIRKQVVAREIKGNIASQKRGIRNTKERIAALKGDNPWMRQSLKWDEQRLLKYRRQYNMINPYTKKPY